MNLLDGVVAHWCNPLTLKPEQSGGVGSRRGKAAMTRGRGSDSHLATPTIPVLGAKNCNFTFTFSFTFILVESKN